MAINRVIIQNYRTLRNVDIKLSSGLNIIVGDNESGKSTLLEAINLALKCQLNRRSAHYELHPFLFNKEVVNEFLDAAKAGTPQEPPTILIELYLDDAPALADWKGTVNSKTIDCPGLKLRIELSPNRTEEYQSYVADPTRLNSIPIEYYEIAWFSFADTEMKPHTTPLKSALIDPSTISNTYAANKYMLEIVKDYLTKDQQVDLALSFRTMKDLFLQDTNVAAINAELATKTGIVSDKTLSMEMDTTTRASWETGVLPHLNDIPLVLVGKGEQNSVKIKLAMVAANACDAILMEEPENHLSHVNLNKLIKHISDQADGKQLLVTTHSSFVLNKLGVESVLMFDGKTGVTIDALPPTTSAYFKKLPGYDTLRMILAERTILVEGPSDELIVQKAYQMQHGKLPIEDGVEVISVRSLAFKRFLDIALLLNIDVRVVTDNDGRYEAVIEKYADYEAHPSITICCDPDEDFPTLEPQLLKANGRELLNTLLGTEHQDDATLLNYMSNNKTDVALMLFESAEAFNIPEYIQNAI